MFAGDLKQFFRGALTRRRLHLTSFDPAKHSVEQVRSIASLALEADTDGFLVGGSTGVTHAMVEEVCAEIRNVVDRRYPGPSRPPIVLFPSNADTGVAAAADGVLFHSLLNSRDVRFLIREQAKAAPYLPALGLQPVGCGMIAVEPGGTAARIGLADLIACDDWQSAVGYAAAAAAFGFTLVYLNAGSGSAQPVPAEMIAAVSRVVDAPLVVGGGVVDGAKAAAAVGAGADIIITGTAIEENPRVGETLAAICAAVHAVPSKQAGATE
ncbi:MAG: phosphoglycerol geranylgeranyltransferase [Candidatus Lernaella stagnicola]|nr:phosphoglycerol geranylgeranyltransferase [Candidatus Lernaella stagnicola]